MSRRAVRRRGGVMYILCTIRRLYTQVYNNVLRGTIAEQERGYISMIDLSKNEQPEERRTPQAYRDLAANIGKFVRRLYEGVKRFFTELWNAVKRTVMKAYTALLQGRIDYYEAALRVTKKTVARRQLIKKQVSLKQMLTSIEGGSRYG